MANRAGPNDWLSADPVDDNGHVAYRLNVNAITTPGTGTTVADHSITNMTGASQPVVAAGDGDNLIFMQAPSGNAGTIWINLAGGTAVVGSGVPILPGGYVTIQPGIANAITGIAATPNDDLTVYAG